MALGSFSLRRVGLPKLHTLKDANDLFQRKRPPIGVTQGGSSRKYAGAKQAATTDTEKAYNPNLIANTQQNKE